MVAMETQVISSLLLIQSGSLASSDPEGGRRGDEVLEGEGMGLYNILLPHCFDGLCSKLLFIGSPEGTKYVTL